jgi:hypothetical protein
MLVPPGFHAVRHARVEALGSYLGLGITGLMDFLHLPDL